MELTTLTLTEKPGFRVGEVLPNPQSRATCVDEELLELYVLNRLGGAMTARIDEHLLVCGDCQDRGLECQRQALVIHQELKNYYGMAD